MRNNARRIWASALQNCATTNRGPRPLLGKHLAFEKHTSFSEVQCDLQALAPLGYNKTNFIICQIKNKESLNLTSAHSIFDISVDLRRTSRSGACSYSPVDSVERY